jgi:quercetin dioxygenase-like cupin family protein
MTNYLGMAAMLLASLSMTGETPAPVQHFDTMNQVNYPWGWIRWMMNSKIDPGAAQTFGIVEIKAGQKNTLHKHPNCEEMLYVLSGSCTHIIGDKKVVIKRGDLIRVPPNTPHQAIVIGNEPMRAMISYSSGDRQVVDLGPGKE